MITRDNQIQESEELKKDITTVLQEKGFQDIQIKDFAIAEGAFPTFGGTGSWSGTAHQTVAFTVIAEYAAEKVPYDDKKLLKTKIDSEIERLTKARHNIEILKLRLENIHDPLIMEFQGKELPNSVIGAFDQLEQIIADLQTDSEKLEKQIMPEDQIFNK